MAKSENQKLKLYYLSKILQEKTDEEHSITMQEIISELGKYDIKAERKSLYDDIRELEQMGIEIEGEKCGRSFNYRVIRRQFELPELKLLVDAIQSSKFITEKKSRALIKKLESFGSEHEAKKLQRQVYVQGRIKTMNESIYYSVDAIHTAIAENKQIKFQYCSWNVKGELEPRHDGRFYTVSPWGVTWDNENYYLIAYDAQVGYEKTFRVDKLIKISVVDEMREGREYFEGLDMAEYSKQNFGMFGGKVERVRISFDNTLVGVFIDRFGKDITIRSQGEGCSFVDVNVAVSEQFFGWIFGLGTKVQIVEPMDIREQMREYTGNILKLYRD